jgi:hypothetical protein
MLFVQTCSAVISVVFVALAVEDGLGCVDVAAFSNPFWNKPVPYRQRIIVFPFSLSCGIVCI